jgi:hypothetical protein
MRVILVFEEDRLLDICAAMFTAHTRIDSACYTFVWNQCPAGPNLWPQHWQ